MHTLFSPPAKRFLIALSAIGALFFARRAAAWDDAKIDAKVDAAPAAAKSDIAPGEKSPKKTAEKPKRIVQSRDGSVVLSGRDATVHGVKLRYEPEKSTLGYWLNADDWVSWEFEITRPGKLIVELTQSCGVESAGSHYTVEVGEQRLKDKVQETGSFRFFRLRRLGTLQFEKPGNYTLSIHVQDKPRLAVMDLRAITLRPPKPEKPAAATSGAAKPVAPPKQ
jgi:hypothetical protein